MSRASRWVVALSAPTLLLAAGASASWLAGAHWSLEEGPGRLLPFLRRSPEPDATPTSDTPPPAEFEPLSPAEAQARNAAIPFSQVALGAPARYAAALDAETPAAALQCLSSAIFYEAGSESPAGQRAVAQVVVNRWASPAFPKTLCEVIRQRGARVCQFSFYCDNSMSRAPSPAGWAEAQTIAKAVLDGQTDADVGSATHYHADYVVPVWATTLLKLLKIGRHIFYRWPGAGAFMNTDVVAAPEPDTNQLGPATPLAASTRPDAAPSAPRPSTATSLDGGPSDAAATASNAPPLPPITPAPSPVEAAPPKPLEATPRPHHRAEPDASLRSGPF